MKWFPAIGVVLLGVTAGAHGPFDNSASLTIGADQVEASLVLGSDAAQEFFKVSGLERPQPVGPGEKVPLAALAGLFELLDGDRRLIPTSARVATDGLEYRFSAQYVAVPRPALVFRARYFELSKQMTAGVLTAQMENGTLVIAQLLSRTNANAEVILPATEAAAAPPATNPSAVSGQLFPRAKSESPPAGRRGRRAAGLVAVVLLVSVVGWWSLRGKT